MSNFETTTNSISAPQRLAREQDGFRSGLRGGDEQAAVAASPRHRQPGRIEIGIGGAQQRAIGRLADQIDERQIEVLRVGLVIEPRIDPVAREQRIAEPHVPPFRQRDRLVELRQGEDAAADQKIAERAI